MTWHMQIPKKNCQKKAGIKNKQWDQKQINLYCIIGLIKSERCSAHKYFLLTGSFHPLASQRLVLLLRKNVNIIRRFLTYRSFIIAYKSLCNYILVPLIFPIFRLSTGVFYHACVHVWRWRLEWTLDATEFPACHKM